MAPVIRLNNAKRKQFDDQGAFCSRSLQDLCLILGPPQGNGQLLYGGRENYIFRDVAKLIEVKKHFLTNDPDHCTNHPPITLRKESAFELGKKLPFLGPIF